MNGLMMDYQLTLPHRCCAAPRPTSPRRRSSRGCRTGQPPPLHLPRTLARRASAARGRLGRLGLERGDRVATLCWNHYAISRRTSASRGRVRPAHAEPAASSERARLHRQPRRGSHRDRRPSARFRSSSSSATRRSSSTSSSSRTPTRSCSPAPTRTPGATPSWTRTRRRRCATRPARRGSRRASSTAIARPSCTRSASPRATRSGSALGARHLLPVVPMFHANAWGFPYLAR